jgi:phospholipid/cholesterol/gamma-HCH transport system substrate-binding protein
MDNASIITNELAEFTYKMNNGNGALSKLITDEKFANSLTKKHFKLDLKD